jgi:hypothetical protein
MLTYSKNAILKFNSSIDSNLSHRPNAKLNELLDYLYACYGQNRQNYTGKPFLDIPLIKKGKDESFSFSSKRGRIQLEAESLQGAVYGLSQWMTVARTDSLAEWMGLSHPRFSDRCLWLGGSYVCELEGGVEITLPFRPSSLTDSSFFRFCQHILHHGYNTVCLGHYKKMGPSQAPIEKIDLAALCRAFQSFGLKVVIRPSFASLLRAISPCPLHPSFQQALEKGLTTIRTLPCDGLFWESLCHHPLFAVSPLADSLTLGELIREEMKQIERQLKPTSRLIYYIPAQDDQTAEKGAKWILFLSRYAGSQTTLAFSAVAGSACHDYLPAHPLWKYLRQCERIEGTPLLPILNGGSVELGEGLWPSLSLDLVEKFVSRCYRHSFKGALILTNQVPQMEGLLGCSLWVLGQSLWRTTPAHLLAETWFQAFRPDICVGQEWLRRIRELTLNLGFIHSLTREDKENSIAREDYRIKAESLLAQLQDLHCHVRNQADHKTSFAPLPDYFSFFLRDARRILLHFLQHYNLPLSNLLTGGDVQPSFWSDASETGGQGLRGKIKITFREYPFFGEKGSPMHRIFSENHLFI